MITVTEISNTSAKVTWRKPNEKSEHEVVYSLIHPLDFVYVNGMEYTSNGAGYAILTDLQPNTEYRVVINMNWKSITFRTGTTEVKYRFNQCIGTQNIDSDYKFTGHDLLVESALQIRRMGSNIMKFTLDPTKYGMSSFLMWSLTDICKMDSFKFVFDMDFDKIIKIIKERDTASWCWG